MSFDGNYSNLVIMQVKQSYNLFFKKTITNIPTANIKIHLYINNQYFLPSKVQDVSSEIILPFYPVS